MINRNRLPVTQRRFLNPARRMGLLSELLDATPRTDAYRWRRAIILHSIDVCRRALERMEQDNAAAFITSTRDAFTPWLN